MFKQYPRRTILGFSLFIGQAFLYNAITFGYAQILATFFHVKTNPGYYFAVIAVGNLLGPLLLARLFDTIGRKPMIAGTYLISGLLLLGTAYLFDRGSLNATTMTACWCAVLFFASAGASSAYLTVSEVFPMETRALAIAFFYAIGTGAGGIAGPLLFSSLVSTGKVADTVVAFCVGAALMIAAGLVEIFLGVKAERQSLEDIAQPLTATGTSGPAGRAAPRPATADSGLYLEEGLSFMDTQTVVVTGASAGIGRATARLFGERGARVALIARGQAGLDGAVRDVQEAGGQALAISADVADYEQVTAAARKAEERFGPIDVWVNVAFTSVFAPFSEITAEEFRRVTEVSYLGFVHGTMAALALMRPRGRGTIVQVGSALGERSIPLQSAYCGAKHAINGFTSSLRCELLHENSGVRVTVVQMPAVNTPQFSWVRSRLPNHPQPVPPIYEPEVAARGVVFAADHPGRKEYWVGASTVATLLANRVVPAVLDRYLGRTGYGSQQTGAEGRGGPPR